MTEQAKQAQQAQLLSNLEQKWADEMREFLLQEDIRQKLAVELKQAKKLKQENSKQTKKSQEQMRQKRIKKNLIVLVFGVIAAVFVVLCFVLLT